MNAFFQRRIQRFIKFLSLIRYQERRVKTVSSMTNKTVRELEWMKMHINFINLFPSLRNTAASR